MKREALEELLERGESIEKIAKRFGKNPSTVSYWLAKYGLVSPHREKHLPRGGLDRETLASLIEKGMTIAEIAEAVGRAKGTVRHWLGRFGLRTRNHRGRRLDAQTHLARGAGRLTIVKECRHHGETTFFLEGRGYYRCKRCRSEAVIRRRRKVKAILVAEAGGRCVICGYDGHPAALEFHHLERHSKLMPVSARGSGLGIATLRAEAAKCILVCSNCHALVQAGAVDLPLEFRDVIEMRGNLMYHNPG